MTPQFWLLFNPPSKIDMRSEISRLIPYLPRYSTGPFALVFVYFGISIWISWVMNVFLISYQMIPNSVTSLRISLLSPNVMYGKVILINLDGHGASFGSMFRDRLGFSKILTDTGASLCVRSLWWLVIGQQCGVNGLILHEIIQVGHTYAA